ncbi:PDR/VanB family oxidoreductase [Arthrobacter sp. SLBN-112]|uniref:PDR/VanB family oxidoreductase n=1 Tax=Arthrobacter sp. SLBN-112 TaxID=2768452 RepID=UPI0027B61971|nr:PDR/VanB family oxidoreductase [Arthrobacter sp. SLBN-112]MDQ0799499.1 ferredoxin-NADP reductase [Arthrobacter sp. SLBN-112]
MTNSTPTTAHTLPHLTHVDAVISDIVTEAEGIISLHFEPTAGVFPEWQPGAHIDLNLAPDLVRQYSLCSDPKDRHKWRVSVLREPQSRGGSEWVHDKLSVGDHLVLGSPLNNFELTVQREYLFIAGGIGITPILPMIAQCEEQGLPWRLIYGGRSESSMAFTAELARYGDKVTLWPQDKHGLIDLPTLLKEPREGFAVYCCGPGVLLDAVESHCEKWPAGVGSLHLERFRPKAGALDGKNTEFEIELDSSGAVFTVAADKSIAETLEAAGVHVPTSCREGTCGTCETVVLEGTPDHRDSYLTPGEKASNEVMMVCCSRSCSKRLVLDL